MTERQWEISDDIATVKRLKWKAKGKLERRAYERLHYILYSWYEAKEPDTKKGNYGL